MFASDWTMGGSSKEKEKKTPSSATGLAKLHIEIRHQLDEFASLQCTFLLQRECLSPARLASLKKILNLTRSLLILASSAICRTNGQA
jgi:hypothetical protein